MQVNNLNKNIFFLTLVQFANYIAPLLVLPYLGRVLGLDGFGVVAMGMSLCSMVLIITEYGFGVSAPYWLAKNKKNRAEVSSYVGAIFLVKALLFLLSVVAVSIYFMLMTEIPRSTLLHVAILASIFFQTFQLSWFFLGIEKMKNVTIFTVTAKLSYLALVFLCVNDKLDLALVFVCYAISNLFATAIGIVFLYKEKYWIARPTKKQTWEVFKNSGLFFISRLAVGVYTSASTFLVGNFAGLDAAALYGSAEKLYQAGQSATSPVSQALYPYLARTGDKQALYKFVGVLLIPLCIGVAGCIYYAEPIITLIFGEEFIAATELLKVFLLTLLINFVGVNFGYPAFSIIGRVDIANKTVIFGAVLQLISILTLYSMSAITAKNICLSVLVVECVVMLIRIITYWGLINNKK
ncbi:oligosaccharide flippase family protein [Plesiomonas shigelloides]|uniref:Putative O-antigen transporter n=1 Tax=Plesiomonas shigelloides TaxID=703 RepID=A0A4D6U7M0_PLESH|nr:oligosaccharide flippase family protein [Plesiomonas shigelloides]QCH03204.1 Wzx [Plesiomonas shigelloides]